MAEPAEHRLAETESRSSISETHADGDGTMADGSTDSRQDSELDGSSSPGSDAADIKAADADPPKQSMGRSSGHRRRPTAHSMPDLSKLAALSRLPGMEGISGLSQLADLGALNNNGSQLDRLLAMAPLLEGMQSAARPPQSSAPISASVSPAAAASSADTAGDPADNRADADEDDDYSACDSCPYPCPRHLPMIPLAEARQLVADFRCTQRYRQWQEETEG